MAVEQLQKFTNNATTTVPGTITNVATSITVATGTGALFPTLSGSEFFIATLVNTNSGDPGFGQMEIIKVTARSGDVMTVVRGQEGTSGTNFPAGILFELRPTAQAFNNIYTEVVELETTKATIDSPTFTGDPKAPTPALNDNDTSIATTAFTRLNPALGSLIGVQRFTASGTYTPTTGTTSIIVEAIGGGGGGGGCAAQGSGSSCVSPGGSAGAYAKVRYTSGFSGATVTIGAGGTGGIAGANGGAAGGTTSFGALISCPGGPGGSGNTGTSGQFFIGAAAPATAPTISGGTTIEAITGGPGVGGVQLAGGTNVQGGVGAHSKFGNPGGVSIANGTNIAITGQNATGFGAGGGGGANTSSAAAVAGGDGTAGLVIVYEYL